MAGTRQTSSVNVFLCTSLTVKCLNAIALYSKLSQSYGASPAVWDHKMLPAT